MYSFCIPRCNFKTQEVVWIFFSTRVIFILVHSKLCCPMRGVGSRFLLMTESQSLAAAKVRFELWYSPCNQPWPVIMCRGCKGLSWEIPPCLPEGPPSMISLLMEGAWLVNEAFCFSGVLKSNSVIIAAGYDSYSRTKSSNNTSAEKVPL